ncbi:uncharacterized protein EI97DRAFT_430374 [Westerdykella ornata]|uniref:RRN7-type domain-containing protein n=1 Tax=Westerdykella ornata TaxID=318751 RepID=A0A6A6JW51_WESOR|nr:uncharacterized protein EI97DRAFT_430374 [Westerdykella ornata]KAF2279279.1 hypothetical protein EI97DRAFT_430374 [Westerdykella ornata]
METGSGRTKGPVCGIENCRSRWYEVGEDGYQYCQNGHRKGELIVGVDELDFNTARRTTTRKKRDDEDTGKQKNYFTSHQAVDLYLKSLQLILRHQLWYLVREKRLPEELETVVSDLWALRILQLENQIGESQQYESESQNFSASENESELERETVKSRHREKKLKTTPTLLDSLALCYLGISTLRLPITTGDIYDWITNGQMPYKRAIKHIPPAMREKLPSSYHAMLDPDAPLKYERFHSTLNDLKISLQREYGVIWPALNRPLLLYRLLKDLALPLEVYDGTVRLARYLNYNFTMGTDGTGKITIRHVPEAQLAACFTICVKLFYPFDAIQRYPRTSSEPAAVRIDWDHWYEHLSSTRAAAARRAMQFYTPEELSGLQEKDVFSMSETQLDQYLDWYHETFIDETRTDQNAESDYRRALHSMFPVGGTPASQWSERMPPEPGEQEKLDVVREIHGVQVPVMVVEDGNQQAGIVRPGERYTQYKTVEDLPQQARRFYEQVGRIMGLSVEMLVHAVVVAERRLAKIQAQQKQERNV